MPEYIYMIKATHAGEMSAEMHEFRVSLLQAGYVPLNQRKAVVTVG